MKCENKPLQQLCSDLNQSTVLSINSIEVQNATITGRMVGGTEFDTEGVGCDPDPDTPSNPPPDTPRIPLPDTTRGPLPV